VNSKVKLTAAGAILVCVAALGTSMAISADAPVALKCSDITWNAELLAKYPRTPAACLEVAVRDGKKYARFEAKVMAVGAESVTVQFLNVAGQKGRPISIQPSATGRVDVDGQKIPYSQLVKGQKITFWVPESRVGVISDPNDTAESTIIMK
jgi:hypothetical protein